MKFVRIWLLVLLAALLPIRGAMASAALLCPPAGMHSHEHAVTAVGEGEGEEPGHHAHGPVHEHAHGAEAAGAPQHHHDGESQDKCSLCASCCAAVPLASTFPSVPEPFDAVQSFPALQAAVPTFQSGGQERPPRST